MVKRYTAKSRLRAECFFFLTITTGCVHRHEAGFEFSSSPFSHAYRRSAGHSLRPSNLLLPQIHHHLETSLVPYSPILPHPPYFLSVIPQACLYKIQRLEALKLFDRSAQ